MPNWTDAPEISERNWRLDWTGEVGDLPQEQLDEIDAELDRARNCSDVPSEWDF